MKGPALRKEALALFYELRCLVPLCDGNVGEFDMQTVLMHELGHAFGLEHNTNGIDRSVMGYYDFRGRFGPYVEDIDDLRVQYGTKTDRRFAVKVSTTDGLSWSDATSNLGSFGVTTSMDPTASRDAARIILFYTHHNKHPAWIHGDVYANNFSGSQWWVFGGSRSAYGTSGHGYDNEYMMAWVDDTDNHHVKVVFSNDGGNSFMWSNPPSDSQSYGTPSVHKVDDNTWVLAYSKFNKTDENANGKIAARISTNDGASWGSEIFLNDFYRAASGVSVSSNGPGEIRIGFAWDDRTTGSNLLKRTIRAHVAAGSLVYDDMMYENEGTRTQPVMTRNGSSYLQAWREMNFATSINTRSSASIDTTWGSYVRAVESAPITPAVAAYRNWYYEYLFYTNY